MDQPVNDSQFASFFLDPLLARVLNGDGAADVLWRPDPDHRGLVPPAMFVVLGDNAMWSYDSRMIGCIPAERLLGVMIRPLNGSPVPAGRRLDRREQSG